MPIAWSGLGREKPGLSSDEMLRAIQDEHLNQLEAQKGQQQLQTGALEQEGLRQSNEAHRRENLAGTRAGDMASWDLNPTYDKPWQSEPSEYKQHFIDAYSPIAGDAAETSNQIARAQTGNPMIGLEGLPEGQAATVNMGGGAVARIASPKPPAKLLERAGRLGIPVEGKNIDEISQEANAKEIQNGTIPEDYWPVAQKMVSTIKNNPVLGPYATQREAYDEVKDGFNNPGDGGFGNMAMTEGFQRLANPRAAVRQGTIQNMQQAAGVMQYLDPSFDWNHAVRGDKYSPEATKRLMDLTESLFKTATARAGSALAAQRNFARSMGVPNPDKFVDSIIGQTVGLGDGEPLATSQAPATPTPSAQSDQSTPVVVNDQSEYDALPVGASGYDSQGNYFVKK